MIFDLLESKDFVEIKKALQIQYFKNMEFFKSFSPKLFSALKAPPTNYNLALDENTIDILNMSDNSLIYNHTLISSHKALCLDPMKNTKYTLYANFSPILESNKIDTDKLPITGEFYNSLLQDFNLDIKNHNLQKHALRDEKSTLLYNLREKFSANRALPSSVFYGLFSGIFLQDLLERGHRFHHVIIYEENIDIFRISLYFLDYALLLNSAGFYDLDSKNDEKMKMNSCLIFIKDISPNMIEIFAQNLRLTNNILLLELKQFSSENVARFQNILLKERQVAFRGWGSFEDEVIALKNTFKNLKSCKILKNPQKINAPICVVGNGPSLDLNIKFLKDNKDKMIIFSAGTALKVLNNHGVRPDFQIEIERVPYLKDILLDSQLNDIPLIHAQVLSIDAVDIAREKYCFIRVGSASSYVDSKLEILEFSAPFVGNAAFSLACIFGSDVIICGLDCGIIMGFSKHSKNSFYGDESDSVPIDFFEVSGTRSPFQKGDNSTKYRVFSNDLFMLSSKNIENAIRFYNQENIINIGYGANINGARNISSCEFYLKSIDKSKEIENIKKCFKGYRLESSLNYLSILENFTQELRGLLRDIHSPQDLYMMISKIEFLLNKYAQDKSTMSAAISFQGSIMHLCFSIFLSFFNRNSGYTKDYLVEFFSTFFDRIQSILKDF